MIKTAQEVNATEASSSKAPTSKERDEQAIVAAAQAATHDNVKSGRTISVVPESVTSFIGSTHKQPQNAFEIIWQALIETVQMRQQCPTDLIDDLVLGKCRNQILTLCNRHLSQRKGNSARRFLRLFLGSPFN